VPAEDSRRTGVDAAAIHHRRTKDRDGPADAGGDSEVRGGVVADEIDHRHLRRTAHNRPRAIEEAHKLARLRFRALSIQRSEARRASHCC